MDEHTFFREMTLRICSSLDIQESLERAFAHLSRCMPADGMSLCYVDLEAAELRVLASVLGPGGRPLWGADRRVVPLSTRLLASFAAKADADASTLTSVVNGPDDVDDPAWYELLPLARTHSGLFLHLGVRDQNVGILSVWARGRDRYVPHQADLIRTAAEPIAIAISNARRYRELIALKDRIADDHRALVADVKRGVGRQIIGADGGLRPVMDLVRQITRSRSPALLLGETGTGKEIIAHAIHETSARSAGPMITMQCGAVPETLLDSELFGHERGAFTGATERKRGRFERADGGTLFLDEIGELSPGAQVKLLRVLQEQRFERVGGTAPVAVDVRVIAATHRDLERMVRAGDFREDLWYRLNVLPIRIPPLRMRSEDIPALVQHFVERKVREMGLPRIPRVPADELARLQRYAWPGNVRELQNLVERALILSRGEVLLFPPLDAAPPASPTAVGGVGPARTASLDEAMAHHIRRVLEGVGWQVAGPGGAAEVLQMNPSTLRFRMKKLGIDRPKPGGGDH